MSAERMPFGRHKGEPIEDLPTSYIAWLLRLDDLKPALRCALEVEYELRQADDQRRDDRARDRDRDDRAHDRQHDEPPAVHALPAPVREAALEIVASGFRRLAAERHPDHGGDHERMVRLTRAVEVLRSVLRQRGAA